MGDALRPSEKAIQLQQYHQRCGKHVERVSPKDALDAKLSEAQSRVHKASQLFGRESTVAVGSGGGSFTNPYLKELRSAMDDMDKLESMRATIEQEESKYQQRLEQQLEQEQANELCEHFNILGFSLCNRVFTEWLATRQVLPTPGEDRVGDEDQSTRMDLVFTPISDGAQQPPAAVLSIMNNTSVTDHVHHTDMSTNDPQRSTEITTTVEDEAQEIRSQSGPARATRMARGEIVAKSLTKTTIDFDQVYQGGNPSHPYVIGEFKDRWYILECKKHNKQFRTDNPVQGAWKHLRSKRHYSDSYGVTYHMAVVELGTEVLNCNKGLSELNNEGTIIHKAKKTKNSQHILPARASQSSSTMNTHESHVSGIWPQLGEVYKTFWRSDRPRKFYAVLILPSDTNLNFSHLIPEWDTSLKHTQLLSCLPPCYVQLENGRLEFTEDHKPGGSKESKRKYPVVFFHKARFPHECELGWVSVSDLEPYDPCDNSIDHRHKQQVNAFLSNYGNVENTGIQGTNGNNVAEPETFHDCLPSLHHSSPAAEESDFSRDSSLLLYDNDIEYEKSLAARTRENSSRVKDEVVQPSPMDMSGGPIRNRDVRASEHSAMPDQEEQDSQAFDPRPVYVQDDYLMDVDSHDDTMTTLEKQLTLKEYRAIVNGMSPQSSTTPLRDPMRPQAEFANMSVDAQAGLRSTGVLISHDAVANPVLLIKLYNLC